MLRNLSNNQEVLPNNPSQQMTVGFFQGLCGSIHNIFKNIPLKKGLYEFSLFGKEVNNFSEIESLRSEVKSNFGVEKYEIYSSYPFNVNINE